MLQEITQFIANKSADPLWNFITTWILDTNLFAGHIPVKNIGGIDIADLPNGCYLAVLENAGGAVLADVGGVVTIGHKPPSALGDKTYWPKYIEKAVQLLNRRDSFFTAQRDAEDLYEAFDQTAGWNLPQVPVAQGGTNRQYLATVIDAYGPPAPLGKPGESGLFTFSCNYTWKIEETSCGV